jgi:hypothetical protein
LLLEPLYQAVNVKEAEPVVISGETMATLRDYYRDEIPALEELTGRRPPWNLGDR